MIQQGVIEGVNEITLYKEQKVQADREKFQLRAHIESVENDNKRADEEVRRLRNQLERERQDRLSEYGNLKNQINDLEFRLE